MKSIAVWIFLVPAVIAPTAGTVFGAGFRVPDQGAAAIAQVDAFTARADDPSAIQYNPAGLIQLAGTQALGGVSLVLPRAGYKSFDGDREKTVPNAFFPFYAYLVTDLGLEAWRFGLGVNTPFGLGTEWSKTGPFRYWTTRSELHLVNINPCVVREILPGLSLAAGVDFYTSELISERQVDFGALLGRPGDIALDGGFRARGDGDGWGYNLALFWQPADRHSFGLAFRSRVDVSYRGEAKIDGMPLILGTGPLFQSDFSSEINFPPYAAFGYSFRAGDDLRLTLDLDWTGWSVIRETDFDFDGNNPLFPDTVIDRRWKDTLTVGLGGEYWINPALSARAGIGYMEAAVPDETFEPAIVDTDKYAFSIGGGYRTEQFAVDIAYLAALGRERRIENSVGEEFGLDLDGNYNSLTQVISLNISWIF